jgi:hypothetical protein
MALTTDPTMALGNLVVDIVEESTRRNLDHSELYSSLQALADSYSCCFDLTSTVVNALLVYGTAMYLLA